MVNHMDEQQLANILLRAEKLCRERGVRLTEQRRFVLSLLCESDKPLTAYDLLDKMRAKIKNPAPPTVYRALDFLLGHGLVHKIESLHAYVGCTHPEHPYASQFLICADCGNVAEVNDEALRQSLDAVGQAVGFSPTKPVVEILGTCSECANNKKTGALTEAQENGVEQQKSGLEL